MCFHVYCHVSLHNVMLGDHDYISDDIFVL